MRTRRSPRNQEALWRALGGPPVPKIAPKTVDRSRCETCRMRRLRPECARCAAIRTARARVTLALALEAEHEQHCGA